MTLPEHLEYVPDVPEGRAGIVRPKQGANRCPECGIHLVGQNPRTHSTSHWPERWDPNNPPSDEARNRKQQLIDMGDRVITAENSQ